MSASVRTRMRPDQRREQLLAIGRGMLADRGLEELSIDLLAVEAGVSKGLLYHYFPNKQAFHTAVVRSAAEDLFAMTAPREPMDPREQLRASMAAYVDYVEHHLTGYLSLVRAASGGNEELRGVYEEGRAALVDRVFESVGTEGAHELGLTGSPAQRLAASGWSAMCERVTLEWASQRPRSLTREQLLDYLAGSLPALLAVAP